MVSTKWNLIGLRIKNLATLAKRNSLKINKTELSIRSKTVC